MIVKNNLIVFKGEQRSEWTPSQMNLKFFAGISNLVMFRFSTTMMSTHKSLQRGFDVHINNPVQTDVSGTNRHLEACFDVFRRT